MRFKFEEGQILKCIIGCEGFRQGSVYTVLSKAWVNGKTKYGVLNDNVELAYFDNSSIDVYFKSAETSVQPCVEDNINHPSHYTWIKELCGVEPLDICRHLDFDLGNALKYILRAGHKKDASMTEREKMIEDLKKAVFYINDKIETLRK